MVEKRLFIHQIRYPHAGLQWLYTALSTATGPYNIRVIDDLYRSVMSDISCSREERKSWDLRKLSGCIYADVKACSLGSDEDGRRCSTALVEEILNAVGGRCNLCSSELVSAVSPGPTRPLAASHERERRRKVLEE